MNVPEQVIDICKKLNDHGFQAYVVGGAVRDMLLNKDPKDWDIATNALPDIVEEIFEKTIPTGKKYGTVTVIHGDFQCEITTFRGDGDYSDGRRPDSVTFSDSIVDDLARRDFTINAIAYNPLSDNLIDPYDGVKDLYHKIIRTVGSPDGRFKEDALRMLRAVRFFATLGPEWMINPVSALSIAKNSNLLCNISSERIRDELEKIIMSNKTFDSFSVLDNLGLLEHIVPEFYTFGDVDQNPKYHNYDVLTHSFRVLSIIEKEHLPLRLAGLLHDVGKPACRSEDHTGVHFYKHDKIGAEMAKGILKRLTFPRDVIIETSALIRNHMIQFERSKNKERTMRRLIANLGGEADIYDLILLHKADRSSHARGPQFEDYDVTEMTNIVDKIFEEKHALKVSDLVLDGKDIMEICKIGPGPMVGQILSKLHEEVLAYPARNTYWYLVGEALAEHQRILGVQ